MVPAVAGVDDHGGKRGRLQGQRHQRVAKGGTEKGCSSARRRRTCSETAPDARAWPALVHAGFSFPCLGHGVEIIHTACSRAKPLREARRPYTAQAPCHRSAAPLRRPGHSTRQTTSESSRTKTFRPDAVPTYAGVSRPARAKPGCDRSPNAPVSERACATWTQARPRKTGGPFGRWPEAPPPAAGGLPETRGGPSGGSTRVLINGRRCRHIPRVCSLGGMPCSH